MSPSSAALATESRPSPRRLPRDRSGHWAEELAAKHLERAGWSILARNFRFGRNEIDLIAERAGVVAFVEVKSRSSGRFGHPLESIGNGKREAIRRAAAGWLSEGRVSARAYRFDAISVQRQHSSSSEPLLQHVEAAWGI